MSSESCTYTTQGNLVCGKESNKGQDSYIQTQFRGGCPKPKEHFEAQGGFVQNQLASAFKSMVNPSMSAGTENFAPVPAKHNSVNVAIDTNATYGLPWAPY